MTLIQIYFKKQLQFESTIEKLKNGLLYKCVTTWKFKYFIGVFFTKTYQNSYIFLKDKITLYYRRFSCKFGDLKVKVLSCKFAAYFQNTFSKEHLWTAVSDTSISIAPNK